MLRIDTLLETPLTPELNLEDDLSKFSSGLCDLRGSSRLHESSVVGLKYKYAADELSSEI